MNNTTSYKHCNHKILNLPQNSGHVISVNFAIFATRLIRNGVDLYTVQKLGKWKTVSMVQRYAHHHPESLRAAIKKIDGIKTPISTILAPSA